MADRKKLKWYEWITFIGGAVAVGTVLFLYLGVLFSVWWRAFMIGWMWIWNLTEGVY